MSAAVQMAAPAPAAQDGLMSVTSTSGGSGVGGVGARPQSVPNWWPREKGSGMAASVGSGIEQPVMFSGAKTRSAMSSRSGFPVTCSAIMPSMTKFVFE
jgi:hypothetical protein